MPIQINKHINHTNNSLIFGEINGNKTQNIPSLKKTLTEANKDWNKALQLIFGEEESFRLAVNSIDDVTRLFKPAYYFKIERQYLEGQERSVIGHSFEYSEDASPIELTKESLCYQILSRKGKVDLSKAISDLQNLLAEARDDYLVAIKSKDPNHLKKQKERRRNFTSKLTEPVLLFLLAAEAFKAYDIKEETAAAPTADGPAPEKSARKRIVRVLVPRKGEKLEPQTIEIARPERKAPEIVDEKVGAIVSKWELNNNVFLQGPKLLADSVAGYLASPSKSAESKQKLLKDLCDIRWEDIENGEKKTLVLAEKITTNIDPSANQKPIEQLLAAPKKFAELGAGAAKAKGELAAGEAKSKSIVQQGAPGSSAENKQLAKYDEEFAGVMHNAVNDVQTVALDYYRDDNKKQTAISKYMYYKFTPVGQLERTIQAIQEQPEGPKRLRGEEGLEWYLKMCIEEACQESELLRNTLKNKILGLEELVMNALLRKPYQINRGEEPQWKEYRDTHLEVAKAIFSDYINEVSKPVRLLLGIDNFLKATQQARKRPPYVIVANMSKDELLQKEFLETFRDFIANGTNQVGQEEFERSISLAVVPEFASRDEAESFLKVAAENGFSVFFSPSEVVTCSDLNRDSKIEELRREWESSGNQAYQSGVLCVPDNVLLELGFKFKLGEFIGDRRRGQACVYELGSPISIRSCFTAAGMVARNDDTYFLKDELKEKARLKLNWPALGLAFDPDKFVRIYEAADLANGVLNDSFLQAHDKLPFGLFYHSMGKGGWNKQRLTALNTLFVLDSSPISLSEYRAKVYLQRVLKLNYPNGIASREELKYFVEHSLSGVYDKGTDNSVLDKEKYGLEVDDQDNRINMYRKDNGQRIGTVEVVIGEAPAQPQQKK